MRAAIVHYWLLNMRGGEKVVEALCRLLPGADLFTLFYDPERVSPFIRAHRVHSSFLQPFRKHYRILLPAMPLALESFDLREYDLVVSSESGPAKGVITPSTARHVCYCHTPMRYLVGPVSRLPQRVDAIAREARSDGALRELPAALGLRIGRARGRICSQQRNVYAAGSGKPTAANPRWSILRSRSKHFIGNRRKITISSSPNSSPTNAWMRQFACSRGTAGSSAWWATALNSKPEALSDSEHRVLRPRER